MVVVAAAAVVVGGLLGLGGAGQLRQVEEAVPRQLLPGVSLPEPQHEAVGQLVQHLPDDGIIIIIIIIL